MSTIDPKDVREALDSMKAGNSTQEVLAVLVAAAESYADMKVEWGFASPQAALYYSSRNDMLIETMHSARPEVDLLARVAADWTVVGPGIEAGS
jgi:hypothetical protein